MLDIKYIRENAEFVKDACRRKNSSVNIDELLRLDAERRELQSRSEELNRERNEASKAKDIERGKAVKEQASEVEARLRAVDEAFMPLLLSVPNMPSDDTPTGKDDSENVVLRKVGEVREFGFAPKDHLELGQALGLIDPEKGSEVAGARFVYLKGDIVLLQNALAAYATSVLMSEDHLSAIIRDAGLEGVSPKPFVPVIPPLMIKPEVFGKMARLEPRDERYHIPSDDVFLIGSAEHTLGPIHIGELLREGDMPLRYFANTPAFRREAGSYGKDTKGILRLHQFDKVEMESFTLPELSQKEQDFFVAIQEHFLKSLGIPYQVVMCCTGDMGDPDARHIDIESWMPGQQKYRETHSADLMNDYQTRRLGTRVKRNDGTNQYVHTNDATAMAMGRLLIAILENYQNEDGSINVPEILVPYMGGKAVIGGK